MIVGYGKRGALVCRVLCGKNGSAERREHRGCDGSGAAVPRKPRAGDLWYNATSPRQRFAASIGKDSW